MSTSLLVKIDALRPNAWNTNFLTPDAERKLDASMERFGLFKPIVVREISITDEHGNQQYEILGGQHRWESAGRIGLEEVRIENLGAISDLEAKEVSLADNARYGADDAIALAELLKDMGNVEELQNFLPYTDIDVKAIFSSADIDIDALDLDKSFDSADEPEEEPAIKAPKTHVIMRFKISLADSERLTRLITQAKEKYGYTAADDLTNAGDALIHLIDGAASEE